MTAPRPVGPPDPTPPARMVRKTRALAGLLALWIAAYAAAAAAAAAGAGPGAAAAAPIHGAGATFPAPLYQAWATDYARVSGVQVGYDAIGSGAGIARIRARRADFGATDAPLTAQELAQDDLTQFPVVIGGVVPVLYIRGIAPGRLRLDGATLADIYLGHIRRWNDPRIAALNPGLALPPTNITVVHRSEASGSSLLWSSYLARTSQEWRDKVGASLTPAWPVGIGGAGNEGVASYVERTNFSLGYVEYAFAKAHHLSDVALINASGQTVRAGRESFQAAADAMDWSSDVTRQLATNLPGAGSWPVTGASFILVPHTLANRDELAPVLKFFDWALHHDARAATALDYVPLPQAALDRLPAQWHALRDARGRAAWP